MRNLVTVDNAGIVSLVDDWRSICVGVILVDTAAKEMPAASFCHV